MLEWCRPILAQEKLPSKPGISIFRWELVLFFIAMLYNGVIIATKPNIVNSKGHSSSQSGLCA